MHVFPRVEHLPEKEEKEDDMGGDLPGESARELLAAELYVFRDMVNMNAPSWIQKRSLLRVRTSPSTIPWHQPPL
eukprot:1189087-Prorocentrum_minimum.AAC.5